MFAFQKWGFDKSGMTVLSHSNGTVRQLSLSLVPEAHPLLGSDGARLASKRVPRSLRPELLRRSRLLLYVYLTPTANPLKSDTGICRPLGGSRTGLFDLAAPLLNVLAPTQPYVAFNFLYSNAKTPIEYLMR